MLVGTAAAEADVLCDRVRQGMKQHAPGEHSLSVSIGVAAARAGEGDTLDELLATADDAMYAGRRRRRRPQRA